MCVCVCFRPFPQTAVVGSYLIAHGFFSVYSMCVDTLFLCFCKSPRCTWCSACNSCSQKGLVCTIALYSVGSETFSLVVPHCNLRVTLGLLCCLCHIVNVRLVGTGKVLSVCTSLSDRPHSSTTNTGHTHLALFYWLYWGPCVWDLYIQLWWASGNYTVPGAHYLLGTQWSFDHSFFILFCAILTYKQCKAHPYKLPQYIPVKLTEIHEPPTQAHKHTHKDSYIVTFTQHLVDRFAHRQVLQWWRCLPTDCWNALD